MTFFMHRNFYNINHFILYFINLNVHVNLKIYYSYYQVTINHNRVKIIYTPMNFYSRLLLHVNQTNHVKILLLSYYYYYYY